MPGLMNRNYASKVSAKDRDQVRRTYGDVCHLCGYRIETAGQFTADHVKAVKAGGSTILSNPRPSHKTCNEFRGARHLSPVVKAECRTRYERLVLKKVHSRVGQDTLSVATLPPGL